MTTPDEKYTRETITGVRVWVPGKLFSLTCTRPTGFRFTAGQFARLGVDNRLQIAGEPDVIWRAYSMVSGPFDEHLEFFSIVVPNGAFTSHLSQLNVGDTLYVDKTNFGFLTTARFESGQHLWLLGSGTGLAPFLSILHDPATWEQFDKIVLVHSARTAEELVYQAEIQTFTDHPLMSELVPDLNSRFVYVPVVTRETVANCLTQRITQLIDDGALEAVTGLPFDQQHSRFMICGNPEMVTDIRKSLKKRGFSPARRNSPGEIAVENYW
ncbi:ferredoxin--NADP reductase [Limnobacter humi]|uniref:ferredoxin--NADP(+) reductase n=1 Tax=Limnobacter humi TaxID=1778671 RepID=A0ABT1WFQ5_9BURK|nr:ferredoxin--NADP reductase [Limnobacter humi]